MADDDAQAGSFCGSLGIDLFEPLSFKGRHGSGLPGGRCAYEGTSLKPRHDWEKFEYSYRIWGRNLYNPKTDPEGWQFHAVIPAAYTQSPFALQYFFELHASPEQAWIFPGLGRTLSQQPYFVVRQKV